MRKYTIKQMVNQALFWVLSFSMVFQPVYPVYAQQINVDAAAANAYQATVTTAPNGVPSVNIVAPNAQGVSHNKFTDYNVGTQGVILNNSTSIGASRLGGVMLNNPNLGNGPAAHLILNEVTSTNPSLLEGMTEVFGQSADVVIANPNGITCHGCGFLNIPQATLTTGVPSVDGNGDLTNLSIDRGTILIDGAGLDATDLGGKARLLARAIQVNGAIQASEIEIVSGRNDINPTTGSVTLKPDDGSTKPSFGIDSAALGGMYADKITLVGTESGVGFKLDGDLAANATDLNLSANGKITFKNATAERHIHVSSSGNDVEMKGVATAEGDVDVSGRNITLNHDAAVVAHGSGLSLQADNQIENNGGVILSNGTAYLSTDKLINDHGWIFAENDLTIEGRTTGSKATLIQNISAAIESLIGNLTLRADTLENKSTVTVSTQHTVIGHQFISGTAPLIPNDGRISGGEWHQVYGDGSATYTVIPHPDVVNEILAEEGITLAEWTPTLWMSHQPDYSTFDWSKWTIVVPDEAQNAPAGAQYLFYYDTDVVSGDYIPASLSTIDHGNMLLDVGSFTNDKSTISAADDLTINGTSLINTGVELHKSFSTGLSYWNITTVRGLGWAGNIWHATNGPFLKSQEITGDLAANIAAGGTLTGTLSGDVSNLTTPVTAVEDSTFGTGSNTIVRTTSNRNPLSHVYVNPARFTPAPAGAGTVFETRERFRSLGSFYGSDYFLNAFATPFDPNDIPRRLGDAYYDTQYISQQILDQTGRRNLSGQSVSLKAQMKQLLDNGAAFANDLMLAPGVALSPEQQAMLTHDIVWYEKIQYNGETVLAPRLYLAHLSDDDFVRGAARISGGNVNLAAANIINVDGAIRADNALRLSAVDSMAVTGGLISGNDVDLTAGQDIVLMTRTDTTGDGTTSKGTLYGDKLGVIARHDLNIQAGHDLAIAGADVSAGHNASLSAIGDVTLTTVKLEDMTDTVGGSSTMTQHSTTHVGTDISAGQNLTIQAGQNATVQGSHIAAGQDVSVKAIAGDTTVTTAENENYVRSYKKTSGGMRDDVRSTTTNVASTIESGGSTTLHSGAGDVTLKAAEINAGGDINLTANAGKVNLEAAKDTDFAQNVHQKSNPVWQAMANEGHQIETIRHTILTGEGQLNITAANGVTVQYHQTNDVKKDIAQLAQAPGLAWMKDLENDPNVNWQGMTAIHKEWSEKHEGLSGPASVVIMVAIAIATSGMGAPAGAAGAAGTAGAAEASAAAAASTAAATSQGMGASLLGVSSGPMAAMADAGFTGLVSQATLALINNKGNPAAALSDLMTVDTVRSLAASIITAGMLDKFGGALPTAQFDGLPAADLFMDIQQQLVSVGVSTTVDTVVTGADFSESLKQNLRFAGAAVLGAAAAKQIGAAFDSKESGWDSKRGLQLIAHAAVGCATGAIAGADCKTSGLATAAGEAAALAYRDQVFKDLDQMVHQEVPPTPEEIKAHIAVWAKNGVSISRLTGALSAAIAGGNATDVQAGAQGASIATENNVIPILIAVGYGAVIFATSYYAALSAEQVVSGLDMLGKDPIGKAIASGVSDAIEISNKNYPEQTQASLRALSAVKETAGVVVTYVDDQTGRVVSTKWDSLSEKTQNRLIGGVGLISAVIPAKGLSTLSKIKTTKSLNTAKLASKVAEEKLATSGITVLGRYPEYLSLANELNAKKFNIPINIWDKMSEAERWAANKKFLDRVIARGDKIKLATPQVKKGSYYERELDYLFNQGYKIQGDFLVRK